MSAIKLKNQIVRTLTAAVGGALPEGVAFTATLRDRRIWVRIVSAPFDVMLPGRIKLYDSGITYAVSLAAGPEKDHTPEACALLAKATAIVKEVCPQGALVSFGSEAYTQQGRRMRDALLAKPTAPAQLSVAS